MDIKITSAAKTDLDKLDRASRSKALAAIRKIPGRVQSDPILRLSSVDEQIRVHRLSDCLRALYRVTDVDKDGADDVVLLKILDRRLAEPIAEAQPVFIEGAPKPVQLGQELAAQAFADG